MAMRITDFFATPQMGDFTFKHLLGNASGGWGGKKKKLSFAGIIRIRFQGSKQGLSVFSQPNAFGAPSLPLTMQLKITVALGLYRVKP